MKKGFFFCQTKKPTLTEQKKKTKKKIVTGKEKYSRKSRNKREGGEL